MTTYFEMGGYAWFVWPAYLFSAIIMIGLVLTSIAALHRDKKTLAALEASNPRRTANRATTSPESTPAIPGEVSGDT